MRRRATFTLRPEEGAVGLGKKSIGAEKTARAKAGGREGLGVFEEQD